jgi:hypothetical protein
MMTGWGRNMLWKEKGKNKNISIVDGTYIIVYKSYSNATECLNTIFKKCYDKLTHFLNHANECIKLNNIYE